MELDDLKVAWQRLDRQLNRQNQLNLEVLRDKKLDKTRKTLRPLYWGRIAQILLGIVTIIFAVAVWQRNLDSTALFVSGLIVHAYGIVLIASGGVVIERLTKLDYSAPVLDIQKQILRIERAYVTGSWLSGLPWWLMWIPYSLGLASLAGIDLFGEAKGSGWLIWSVVVGVIGMLLTWLWYRWSTSAVRPERAARVNQSLAGSSLTNARRLLAEIEQFEQEDPLPR